MFHQVRVDPKDHAFLKFLWWPQGDATLEPEAFCMKVDLFGATSSPSYANFSLLQTAKDNSEFYDQSIVETVQRNFCMDDCLKSVSSKKEALHLYHQLTDLLMKGGFHLTKLISNSSEVLNEIPVKKRSSSVLNLNKGELACARC